MAIPSCFCTVFHLNAIWRCLRSYLIYIRRRLRSPIRAFLQQLRECMTCLFWFVTFDIWILFVIICNMLLWAESRTWLYYFWYLFFILYHRHVSMRISRICKNCLNLILIWQLNMQQNIAGYGSKVYDERFLSMFNRCR